MGADLYIKKHNSGKEEDLGYFRDSYNQTNILWRFGLSYWQLEKQIPIGKIRGRLMLKQVKILRAELEKRKQVAEDFYNTVDEKWLKEHFCEEGVKGWVDYWREKQERFFKFLDHAIELKSGIGWSV